METLKHLACTVGWVVQLCHSWLSLRKATWISHGRISVGQYSCKIEQSQIKKICKKFIFFFKLVWSSLSRVIHQCAHAQTRLKNKKSRCWLITIRVKHTWWTGLLGAPHIASHSHLEGCGGVGRQFCRWKSILVSVWMKRRKDKLFFSTCTKYVGWGVCLVSPGRNGCLSIFPELKSDLQDNTLFYT